MILFWVHSISQWHKCLRNRTTLQICTTFQDRSIRNDMKRTGADSGVCPVARPDLLKPKPYHLSDATAKYRQCTEQARNITA